MVKKILLSIFLISITFQIQAQIFGGKKFPRKGEEAELFEKAENELEGENYSDAALDYEKLLKDNPDEPILKFRLGICYLTMADKIETALEYLEPIDYVQYSAENVEYYLARAYHLNSKYQLALDHFEGFKKNKNSDKKLVKTCDVYIENCKNGVELSKDVKPYTIKNLGAPINTKNSEYAPIITSDESQIFYTYRGTKSLGGLQAPVSNPNSSMGEYYEDIFYSYKDEKGNWTEPAGLPEPINNDQNNASVSISGDGQQLYIFNSTPGDLGSISHTKLFGKEWTEPELIPGDVNGDSWEGHITLSSDKKYMIFASERPGGYGGIDLYSAELQTDFSYGNIKNLGPEINTELDEHGPFIHPSGQFFVFSSKGHNNIGGYDLYSCIRLNDSTWDKPKNMGIPLNTPLDDVFYSISGDGKHGYYSSGKTGGFGAQDIYITQPSIDGITINLAQLKGNVTLNDQPVQADIKIIYTGSNEEVGNYLANGETGKYLADLYAGHEYKITYTIDGLAPQTRILDTRNISGFKAFELNVQFYKKDSSLIATNNANNNTNSNNNTNTNNGDVDIEALLSKYADYTNGKLKYHVQIGAYVMPVNFDYGAATKYGKVEQQRLDDQITRFVIGTMDKLSEARILCQKIKDAGITDAFVTGEYEGKRYMLRDLALNKFFSEE